MSTQETLASYFVAQAEWRLAKEQEYGDARNADAATALQQLSEHVLRLPDDDARIAAVSAVTSGELDYMVELHGLEGGLEDGSQASRIGFGNSLVDVEHELTWYVRDNLQAQIRQLEADPSVLDDGGAELKRLQAIELDLLAALAGR